MTLPWAPERTKAELPTGRLRYSPREVVVLRQRGVA